jgi:hypothetical protein
MDITVGLEESGEASKEDLVQFRKGLIKDLSPSQVHHSFPIESKEKIIFLFICNRDL